ncbi:MAG: hypothetical protein QME65_02580 [Candidatus Omnitrophota bacterium]|nr:hypothetical protein [Candidatus Omnitrophota bacterium]
MKIEKEKYRVHILCLDGCLINGVIHITPGLRILDFANDKSKSFIAVTAAEICSPQLSVKNQNIILNKSAIQCLLEI